MSLTIMKRNSGPDLVLLDDEEIIRESWLMEAESARLRLLALPTESLLNEYLLDPTVPIFVDYELGSPRSGLDVAKALSQRGHKTLILTTGHKMQLAQMPGYIAAIRGKSWPVELIAKDSNINEGGF